LTLLAIPMVRQFFQIRDLCILLLFLLVMASLFSGIILDFGSIFLVFLSMFINGSNVAVIVMSNNTCLLVDVCDAME